MGIVKYMMFQVIVTLNETTGSEYKWKIVVDQGLVFGILQRSYGTENKRWRRTPARLEEAQESATCKADEESASETGGVTRFLD